MVRLNTPKQRGTIFTRTRDAVIRLGCRIAGCEHHDPPVVAESAFLSIEHSLLDSTMSGSPDSASAVVALGLTKIYADGVFGAQDINLEVKKGEIVSILGPNGAGKSTILNMVVGLLRPTAGSATVHSVPSTDIRRASHLLGVALQSTGLDPSMTAREHMKAQAALYSVPRRNADERGAHLMETLGLVPYADRPVVHFSTGLQRRLVLGLALVHDPPVIVFDEPTAGLDPQSRRLMWDLLEKLRSEGRAILFSTQILEEADALAQRLYVIDGGRLVAAGSPAELRRSYGEYSLRVRVAEQPEAAADLVTSQFPDLGPARLDAGTLVFTANGGQTSVDQVRAALADADMEVLEISLGRPSLEDAFIQLTGKAVRTEPLVNANMSGGPLCRCQ